MPINDKPKNTNPSYLPKPMKDFRQFYEELSKHKEVPFRMTQIKNGSRAIGSAYQLRGSRQNTELGATTSLIIHIDRLHFVISKSILTNQMGCKFMVIVALTPIRIVRISIDIGEN